MADENGASGTKEKRAKKVTFIYILDGEVKLVKHETRASSVKESWRNEVLSNFNKPEGEETNMQLVGAVAGHVDFMTDHIRKPTYNEMKAMLDAVKGK